MAAKASAGANAPDKQQRLQRLIECPVCLNELQDPRMLTCRHALCYTCLKDYTVKNDFDKELPCPVCREVTALYEGGVDNLPKFFFMNELKEVVMGEEEIKEIKEETPGKPRGVVCSTEDCDEVAVIYCTEGCEFQCHKCVTKHNKFKGTKLHKVIGVPEAKEFIKRHEHPYPPCRRHKHQLVDMYCLKCKLPMCSTCSVSVHDGHRRCELERQGAVCKKRLEQTTKHTDGLIDHVKKAMVKTKQQAEQAEKDIDNTCEKVKSTFKSMHERLDKEEKNMLLNLQEVRRRMQKTVNVTSDSQALTLASLESLRSSQVKLADADKAYDYVTSTESLQKALDNHVNDLQGFMWRCDTIKKSGTDEMFQGRVDIKQSELHKKREEVGRIHLHNQDKHGVLGMVVYKERVYVVHYTGLVVYCYNPDGSLIEKYKHKGGAETIVQGMCLMTHGGSAMLVVCDLSNKALIWIKIMDDFTMRHHLTQRVDYYPRQLFNDRGNLTVCDYEHYKLHRYTADGQPLDVITVPGDINPGGAIRHGDGDHYVVTDWMNHQVAVVGRDGRVTRQYRGDIHGVKLDHLFDITTDKHGRILMTDNVQHHVLLLSRDMEEVKQLLQKQFACTRVCLDEEGHKMYVAARDMDDHQHFVFVYDYDVLTGGKTFTEKITKLDMVTVM